MTSSKTWIGTLAVALLLSLGFATWTAVQWIEARTKLVLAEAALKAAEAALVAARASAIIAAKKAKWRQKAAAKAKRVLVLAPVIGAAAVAWFEEQDYREWRQEHPEISNEVEARKAYLKEMYDLAREMLDEELADWKTAQPQLWKKVLETLDDWYRRALAKLPG